VAEAVEPDVAERDAERRVLQQRQDAPDVVLVDVADDQQLEVAIAGVERGDPCAQGVPGLGRAGVDQRPPGVRRVALLEPEGIALARREHLDLEHDSLLLS
jgi:hypothetical protein